MARISKKKKAFIAERANHCCEYCLSQAAYSPDYFSAEHTAPLADFGKDDVENIAYSCQSCNNHKYIFTNAVDPLTGTISPLFNPRQHVWAEHFIWADNFSILEGISPTGRCTIERLKLNRVSVVNLRVLLVSVGKHPPY